MDRAQLADFLRTRREALQPEDVGLPRGLRRRTTGLRREEVAVLVGMSTDYYSRLEQRRGPQPSEQMVAAIARGLHLSFDERDHLFRLAGHGAPTRVRRSEHVSPGMMRILDGLGDTPAQVISDLGEVLVQTPLAMALLGDLSGLRGLERVTVYRWFTAPGSRDVYPVEDHPDHARIFTAELRSVAGAHGPGSRAAEVVDRLLETSAEFGEIWAEHRVAYKHPRRKRLAHPDLGVLTLDCHHLLDEDHGQRLLVFTATPGTEDAERLKLLAHVGPRPVAAT